MYHLSSDFVLRDVAANHKDVDILVYWMNTSSAREAFDFDGVWTPGMVLRNAILPEPDYAASRIHWIVENKHSSGEYVPLGTVMLVVDTDNCTAEYDRLFMDPHVRNIGFGTKTLAAVASYAFDILKLKYIYGTWKPTNEFANRMHDKLKFPHLLNQNDGLMHSSISANIWNTMRLTVKAEQKFDIMMDEVL